MYSGQGGQGSKATAVGDLHEGLVDATASLVPGATVRAAAATEASGHAES